MTSLNFANVKGKNIIICITSCVLFSLQIVLALLLLSGVVDYCGSAVTALGAVEILISIVNIAFGAVFEYLLKFMVGIAYVAALVVVIKNIIASITHFVHAVFDKGEKNAKIKEDSFSYLQGYVGSSFKSCIIFMLLAVMASADFTVCSGGIAVFIIGACCYFGIIGITAYLKNLKLECLLYRAGATVIMLVAYGFMLFKVLSVASFEQTVYGFKVIFGGYLGAISTETVFSAIMLITMPILYMVLQFTLYSYVSDVWSFSFYILSEPGSSDAARMMGVSIAIICVNILVDLILNNMQMFGLSQIYKQVQGELPMLVASIVLFVCYRFEKFEEVNQVKRAAPASADQEASDFVPVQAEAAFASSANSAVNTAVSMASTLDEPATPAVPPIEHHSPDVFEELKKYKELLNSGILTQEEFDAKKKEILGL